MTTETMKITDRAKPLKGNLTGGTLGY
uniref:Uncharacterized protein n=1 Tax=Arundo donax TaxID=35708 RepID=A0A0A9EK85_ARUDO